LFFHLKEFSQYIFCFLMLFIKWDTGSLPKSELNASSKAVLLIDFLL
jgi:hypothetical protein